MQERRRRRRTRTSAKLEPHGLVPVAPPYPPSPPEAPQTRQRRGSRRRASSSWQRHELLRIVNGGGKSSAAGSRHPCSCGVPSPCRQACTPTLYRPAACWSLRHVHIRQRRARRATTIMQRHIGNLELREWQRSLCCVQLVQYRTVDFLLTFLQSLSKNVLTGTSCIQSGLTSNYLSTG